MKPLIKSIIGKQVQEHWPEVSTWIKDLCEKAPPPFYSSVDLRDAGFKIASVDCNLYPAGFNNLCPEDHRAASPVLKKYLNQVIPSAKKILIIPESHTKNTYYIENLEYLTGILQRADFDVRLGWYGELPEPIVLEAADGAKLKAYPTLVKDGILQTSDFVPEIIILNNDFSGGYPKILDAVKQPIVPGQQLGWHSRTKGAHFHHYNLLAAEFASILKIDPWMLQVQTETVEDINFNEDVGLEQVAQSVARVLENTAKYYKEYDIKQQPFAFVKSNRGTYGMGIMVVRNAEEVLKLNRRTKNKMSVGKNRLTIDSVIVQEGIPTGVVVNRLAAEPVVYLCGGNLIGGFLRANTEKSPEENLNSEGMVFQKLCMSDLQNMVAEEDTPPRLLPEIHDRLMELVYGSVARLSAFAAGFEFIDHGVKQPGLVCDKS